MYWRAVIGTGSAAANFEPAVYIARCPDSGSLLFLWQQFVSIPYVLTGAINVTRDAVEFEYW